MDEESREIFILVLAEILEQFAFVFLEDDSGALDCPEEDTMIMAEIDFYSQLRSGSLIMATTSALCSEVAQNVLGVEATGDLPGDVDNSALQEVVNIACGNLLARIYGTEEMFEMTVPRSFEISAQQWRSMAQMEDVVSLLAEEEPVLARLVLD